MSEIWQCPLYHWVAVLISNDTVLVVFVCYSFLSNGILSRPPTVELKINKYILCHMSLQTAVSLFLSYLQQCRWMWVAPLAVTISSSVRIAAVWWRHMCATFRTIALTTAMSQKHVVSSKLSPVAFVQGGFDKPFQLFQLCDMSYVAAKTFFILWQHLNVEYCAGTISIFWMSDIECRILANFTHMKETVMFFLLTCVIAKTCYNISASMYK